MHKPEGEKKVSDNGKGNSLYNMTAIPTNAATAIFAATATIPAPDPAMDVAPEALELAGAEPEDVELPVADAGLPLEVVAVVEVVAVFGYNRELV